jgi:hypothetical protein
MSAGPGDRREAKILRVTPSRNPSGTMLAWFSAQAPSGVIYHKLRLMVGARSALGRAPGREAPR